MYVINSSWRRNRGSFTPVKRAKNSAFPLRCEWIDPFLLQLAAGRPAPINWQCLKISISLENHDPRKIPGYLRFKIIMLVVSSPFDICLVKLDHFPRGSWRQRIGSSLSQGFSNVPLLSSERPSADRGEKLTFLAGWTMEKLFWMLFF